MKTFIDWCKAMALLAVTFVCVIVGITVLQIHKVSLSLIGNQQNQIAKETVVLNEYLQQWSNRADLTWKNVDYLILKLGLTADNAKQASAKELATLDTLNKGINASVIGLNETLATANTTISEFGLDSSATLAVTNTAIAKLPPMLDASTATLESINKQVGNPAIATTIDNVADTTGSIKIIAKNAADETTKLVHPNKKKLGFWGTLDATALYIHNHFLPPLL